MTASPNTTHSGTAVDALVGKAEWTIHERATHILGVPEHDLRRLFRACVKEHARLIEQGAAGIRKNAPESAVTLVDLPGLPRVCVKEFRWRGYGHALKGLFRTTQGLRTYRNAGILDRSGIGAAAALGLARVKRGGLVVREWVIMEVIPGAVELDRYVLSRIEAGWSQQEKRAFARTFGEFIGSMHAKGIVHADLKTCNILVTRGAESPGSRVPEDRSEQIVSEPSIRFAVIDYDGIKIGTAQPVRNRVKNLVQIFLSTPTACTVKDRLRFLRHYARHAGISGSERRVMARQVRDAVRGKNILYVGFAGDVIERWPQEQQHDSLARGGWAV